VGNESKHTQSNRSLKISSKFNTLAPLKLSPISTLNLLLSLRCDPAGFAPVKIPTIIDHNSETEKRLQINFYRFINMILNYAQNDTKYKILSTGPQSTDDHTRMFDGGVLTVTATDGMGATFLR